MPTESISQAEEALDDDRRRATVNICQQFRRGIITAEHACEKFLVAAVEPSLAAEYMKLLPDALRSVLPAVLAGMPTSDEAWSKFDRWGQFDGSESTWVEFILECRANTEAVRACALGGPSPPAASNFLDQIRVASRARMGAATMLHASSSLELREDSQILGANKRREET